MDCAGTSLTTRIYRRTTATRTLCARRATAPASATLCLAPTLTTSTTVPPSISRTPPRPWPRRHVAAYPLFPLTHRQARRIDVDMVFEHEGGRGRGRGRGSGRGSGRDRQPESFDTPTEPVPAPPNMGDFPALTEPGAAPSTLNYSRSLQETDFPALAPAPAQACLTPRSTRASDAAASAVHDGLMAASSCQLTACRCAALLHGPWCRWSTAPMWTSTLRCPLRRVAPLHQHASRHADARAAAVQGPQARRAAACPNGCRGPHRHARCPRHAQPRTTRGHHHTRRSRCARAGTGPGRLPRAAGPRAHPARRQRRIAAQAERCSQSRSAGKTSSTDARGAEPGKHTAG